MQSMGDALRRYATERPDPVVWWSDYGAVLLAHPIQVRPPPLTRTWEANGSRGERPNAWAVFKRDQADHRRRGAYGAVEGWTSDAVSAAYTGERKPWDDWYHENLSRFRELTHAIRRAHELEVPHAITLMTELLEQGDAMYSQLSDWYDSGVIPWLPFVNEGERWSNMLVAWGTLSRRWWQVIRSTPRVDAAAGSDK